MADSAHALGGQLVSGSRAARRVFGSARQYHSAPLGSAGAYRRGRHRSGRPAAVRLEEHGYHLPASLRGMSCAIGGLAGLDRALPQSASRSRRSHPQPHGRACLHERRGWRSEVALLSLIGQDQRGRHHPLEFLHGFGSLRASATRISTSNGKAQCTISPRSTTSFTAKSIEYMQSVVGPRPSKWCAGCHDHAVFFNGRFDRPIKEQIDTPEARAGLSCTSCHAITHVDSSMGNGGFTIEYPPLHQLARQQE